MQSRVDIIKKYNQYLKLEKGLSLNTLEAYNADITKLLVFLEGENIELLNTTPEDLEQFIAGLHDIGITARSQARIMSGIKSLFGFLMLEKIIEKDPSELIDNPRIGFKIPEVLSIQEIDSIIAAVDLSKKEGQRNRALLETLYSCGLRVSELITLKLSDLYLDDEFIRVEGKGQKQRLVKK